jgi:hypothetical protein
MTTTKLPALMDGREYDETPIVMDRIQLRALTSLTAGGRQFSPGDTFSLDTEHSATLRLEAISLVRDGKAERIGTPNWWIPMTVTVRAVTEVGPASGRPRTPPGTVFELRCETRDEREQVSWGVSCGQWELVGDPPVWWAGPRSTRPTNRPLGEAWAAH